MNSVNVSAVVEILRKAGAMMINCHAGQQLFRQGDLAESIFHVESGQFTLASVARNGKLGLLAIAGAGEFFGEGCLDEGARRTYTVVATEAGRVWRCSRRLFAQLLRAEPEFAADVVTHMVAANQRFERRVLDAIVLTSDRRLAVALVAFSNTDGAGRRSCPRLNQDLLAAFVGTTRPRITFFMVRFRALGLIDDDGARIVVHQSLVDFANGGDDDRIRSRVAPPEMPARKEPLRQLQMR